MKEDRNEKIKINLFCFDVLSFCHLRTCGGGICLTRNLNIKNKDENNLASSTITPTNTDYWTDSGNFGETGISGAGTEEDPFIISSAADLSRLSHLVYSGTGNNTPVMKTVDEVEVVDYRKFYDGKYFKQTADINLAEHYWVPIGRYYDLNGNELKHYFSGYYDGDNHTISGLIVNSSYAYQGLFGYAYASATRYIKNVNISSNSSISGNGYTAGILGYGNAYYSLINCSNAAEINSTGDYTGGITGNSSTTNCSNTGIVSSTGKYTGGVTGNGSATDCNNSGTISGSDYTAGITGSGNVTNCNNTGDVTSTGSYTGGIVGYGSNIDITKCNNFGSVSSTSYYVGGIIGYLYAGTNDYNLSNCCNNGIVSGVSDVGGIIGFSSGSIYHTEGKRLFFSWEAARLCSYSIDIRNCCNLAKISGDTSVGGIVGNSQNTNINECYNIGNIQGTGYRIGGILGGTSDTYSKYESINCLESYWNSVERYYWTNCGYITYIKNCYNLGNVSSTYSLNTTIYGVVGGIAGSYGRVINDCYTDPSTYGTAKEAKWNLLDKGNKLNIRNCYNAGNVSAPSAINVGGILGRNGYYYSSRGTTTYENGTSCIYNCVNIDVVTGKYLDSTGAILGYAKDGSLSGCYYLYLSCANGVGNSLGGTRITDLKSTVSNKVWYTNTSNWYVSGTTYDWDFDTIWDVQTCNHAMPVLRWNCEYISCDPNGGTMVDTSDKLVAFNHDIGELDSSVKYGVVLDGWYTEKTGGTKVTADMIWGQDISDVETLYAHWKVAKHTVSFDANGGSGTMASLPLESGRFYNLPANTFTNDGYKFKGWTTTEESASMGVVKYIDEDLVSNLTMTDGGSVTLYAVWEGITYYVKFDGNGGAGSVSDQKFKYGESDQLNTNRYVKPGYTFAGWAISQQDADDGNVLYTDNQFVSNLSNIDKSSVTLYAVWQKEYTAHFDSALGHWYTEIGFMPQTRVSAWFNGFLNSMTLEESGKSYKVSDILTLNSYVYAGEEYCKHNNQWYHVEPVRWRLSGTHTEGEILSEQDIILSKIVYISAYSNGTTDYTQNAANRFFENIGMSENLIAFTPSDLDGYNDYIYIASESEINAVAGIYDVGMSDLVCDLLTDRYYYVRNLGTDGNIKVYSFIGFDSQRAPNYRYGMQFIMKVGEVKCV